jgi:hypothetical protein
MNKKGLQEYLIGIIPYPLEKWSTTYAKILTDQELFP